MADLTQKEMEKLFNEAEPSDPNQSMSQEEMKELFEKKDPSVVDSFVSGAVNQLNIIPKWAGFSGAIRNDKPEDISQADWDKLSFWEKYDILKKPYDIGFKRIREAHPVADVAGNITGGMLVPSGGGVALKAAGKLGAGAVGKAAANILGNAAEGSLQSYSFADDGNKGEAAAYGAGIGAAVPLAGAGLSKLIKSGRTASKYAERADEIKAARKNEKTAGEIFEENLRDRAGEVQAKAENEAIDFSDAFRKDTEKAIEKGQVLDQELVDTTLALQKGQRELMKEESSKGWDKLSNVKDIDTRPLLEKIKTAYNKFEPDDPNAIRLKKFVDDLDKDNIRIEELKTQLAKIEKENVDPLFGTKPPEYQALEKKIKQLEKDANKISEVDLKKKIKRYWNEIDETEVTKSNRGVWIPLSSRELMNVADTARDILVRKNKDYAAIVGPLAKRVEKFKRLAGVLKLDGDDASILKRLKQYKSDKQIRDAIAEFKEVTGTDLIPMIEKSDNVKLSATSPEFKKDLVDIIVNKNSKNTDYKKLVRGLEAFDKENKTNYAQMLKDIRTNNMVETLQKANKFLTIGDKQQVSKLDALFGNVIPVDLKPAKDNALERVLFKGKLQDQAKIKGKDKNTRELLNKFSEFMGQDAEKNLRAIENENLYDMMGTSSANGSRRVNLGANWGEWIHEGLKKSPGLGRVYGSTLGALIDNGVAQRLRRELLEKLYTLEKNSTNILNPKSNIPEKLGARVLAPQASSYLDREEKNKQAWENLRSSMVEKQMEKNEEYFGRRK